MRSVHSPAAAAPDVVRAEPVAGRGMQFDPTLVDVLLGLLDRLPEFHFDGVLLFRDAGRGERPASPVTGWVVPRGPMLSPERWDGFATRGAINRAVTGVARIGVELIGPTGEACLAPNSVAG